jgi:hypothetical protein
MAVCTSFDEAPSAHTIRIPTLLSRVSVNTHGNLLAPWRTIVCTVEKAGHLPRARLLHLNSVLFYSEVARARGTSIFVGLGRLHLSARACMAIKSAREASLKSVSPAGQDGRTSLIAAALNGHRDALEVLLEAKADINAVGEVRSDGSVYRGLDWESDWWWVVLSYMR